MEFLTLEAVRMPRCVPEEMGSGALIREKRRWSMDSESEEEVVLGIAKAHRSGPAMMHDDRNPR